LHGWLAVAKVSLESIDSILDVHDTTGDEPDGISLRNVRGQVTFRRRTLRLQSRPRDPQRHFVRGAPD